MRLSPPKAIKDVAPWGIWHLKLFKILVIIRKHMGSNAIFSVLESYRICCYWEVTR